MKDFTSGKVSKILIRFTVPMIVANLFQNLYNVIDSVIVGNFIGKEALGAVGASFPILFALISLVIGVGSGASTVVSQYFGAKQTENVKRTIDTIFIFFLVSSLIVSLIGVIFARQVFVLIRLPEEIIPDAVAYFQIYLSGMFFFFGFSGLNSILRGLGDAKTPLYFVIFATVANTLLDLLFVVVFKWGIEGAALATLISHAIAFMGGIIYLNRSHPIIDIRLRKYFFDIGIFKSCVRIGLPTGLQQSFVAVGMMVIMWIINGFGTNAIAAYTAAMRIDMFAKMPAITFAQALTSFSGQNLGAFQEKRARTGMLTTLGFSMAYCVVISVIIIVFGNSIMKLFTPDKGVIKIGQDYLVIVSSFYVLFFIMFIVMGFLRGAGATFVPMLTTFIGLYLVRIPVAYFLSKEIGVNGIWWSEPAGLIVGVTILTLYFLGGKWRGKLVVKEKIPESSL